jgi:hypothetical protein
MEKEYIKVPETPDKTLQERFTGIKTWEDVERIYSQTIVQAYDPIVHLAILQRECIGCGKSVLHRKVVPLCCKCKVMKWK